MYCIHCGKQIEDGSAFCAYCGKSQDPTAQTTENSASAALAKQKAREEEARRQDTKIRRTFLLPTLCALAVIVIIVIFAVARNVSRNPGRNTLTGDDITDQVTNVLQSTDTHVLSVKNGSPLSYPDQTYGAAFDYFFAQPAWKYFVGLKEGPDDDGDGKPDYTEDNLDIVEFTGYCTYQGVEVKARIQFTLNQDGKSFEATYLSFNDVPQSGLMLVELIGTAFASYQENMMESSAEAEKTDHVMPEPQPSVEVTPQNTENPGIGSAEWARLFLDTVRGKTDIKSAALHDLTGDGIPELWLYREAESDYAEPQEIFEIWEASQGFSRQIFEESYSFYTQTKFYHNDGEPEFIGRSFWHYGMNSSDTIYQYQWDKDIYYVINNEYPLPEDELTGKSVVLCVNDFDAASEEQDRAGIIQTLNAVSSGSEIPEVAATQPTEDELYRVRKSWEDTSSQIGAFKVFDNAMQLADDNPGYSVFDSQGNMVYPLFGGHIEPSVMWASEAADRLAEMPWYGTYYPEEGYSAEIAFFVDAAAGPLNILELRFRDMDADGVMVYDAVVRYSFADFSLILTP